MSHAKKILISAASGLAISLLPVQFDTSVPGGLGKASAYAKSDNAGGNGKGGGNGGAKEGGSAGKSASAPGKTKSAGDKLRTASSGGFLKSIFGGKSSKKTAGGTGVRTTSKGDKSKRNLKAREAAVLPASMLAPEAKPQLKEKNLNARLAGLNSLKRNYHAYLNSQDPRMAAIREFVIASAEYDMALADLETGEADLAAAQASFAEVLTGLHITPYDGDTGLYADPTIESLNTRLTELSGLQADPDWATLTPEERAPVLEEAADLKAALATQQSADLAVAETAAAAAQQEADAAADGTDDEALKEALLAAANKNRLEEYGDSYIDQEILDWAKGILGVGDAYGKIDEVKETLEPAT